MSKLVRPSDKISIDTETTGLNTWTGDRPYIVSWCWFDKKETQGLTRWEVDPFTRKVTPVKGHIQMLRDILEDPSITKVFHNAKFDRRMLESVGLVVKGRIEDTQIMMRCFHNDLPTYSLKPLCDRILDMDDEDLKALRLATNRARAGGKKLGYKLGKVAATDYWMVEDQSFVAKYAVLDAVRTKRLHEWLEDGFKDDNQRKVYEKELKLMEVTYAMETRGVSFSMTKVNEEIAYHKKIVEESYLRFCKLAGVKDVNLNSNPQLATILYDKFKLPCKHFTTTGDRSVNNDALREMSHTAIDALTDHSASSHALSSFFDIYARESEVRDDGTYVLHPDFQQMGAKTGRYSCRRPNLQNVANALTTRSAKPIQARRPFRPERGKTWFAIDYSQIEVFVFALLSGEKLMLEALLSGRDLHTETANHIWGKGRDIVAEEKAADGKSNTRARAKMLLFGKIYGMGVVAAQGLIRCTKQESRQYLDEFDRAFSTISQFMETYSRMAETKGFIENAYGRRYFIDPEFSYRAVNYLVQGSCADLLKEKMQEVHDYLISNRIGGGIIMTIHDEILLELENKFITKTLLLKIKDIMEDHHGVFPIVKKFNVEATKITYDGSWDKKVKLKL